MNKSPVTLISQGSLAIVRPITETTGQVVELTGFQTNCKLWDIVSLPQLFITAGEQSWRLEHLWQLAELPKIDAEYRTNVTPGELENTGVWGNNG
jgi:hypothetical protein